MKLFDLFDSILCLYKFNTSACLYVKFKIMIKHNFSHIIPTIRKQCKKTQICTFLFI